MPKSPGSASTGDTARIVFKNKNQIKSIIKKYMNYVMKLR